MDGAMGQEEDVVEAVLTCEGDFHDPELSIRIERFRHRLKDLLLTEKQRLQVKKIEPWNSVKVTVTIPRAAAIRLRQLAQNGNDALRQMGVLSVQIQGDSQISLTIAGRNNEPTQLLLRTLPVSQAGNSSLPLSTGGSDSGVQNSEDYGSPQGSSSDDLTRRNIVNYLRQGSGLRQNAIFDSILASGTSSVPVHGFGLDLPQPLDSVAGPSGSSTVFRPNSIVSTSLQSSSLKGSHMNSSFPFTKTPGAFHPPVSRLSSSAGQSSATNTTHHIQPGNGRLVGSLGHDTQNTQQSLSCLAPGAHMFQHSMNTFNPVNTLRLSPAASSAHVNALPLHVPPSSPTPSFMIDLPPPPPYPSGSNANRQGKPVTSSSPLLVNLLQTDPLTAAVGLSSGNPNKPLTAGDFNSGSPSKKRRPKKQKDGVMKAYLTDSAVGARSSVHSWLFPSDVGVEHSNHRVTESSATSLDFMPSRTDMLTASHIADSFMLKPLPDCKPSFLSDRPGSESHIGSPSDEFHSDFSSRSAIGAGYSSSNISDSNGQDPFPKDLDPFSMEIAAGKIINPITGHLEPRDSTVDSVQARASDQNSYSQSDHFATQMLARKAKELKSHENSVPNSSSPVLDVHVMKTAIAIHNNVSTSTAAALRSGEHLPTSSDRLTPPVSTHRHHHQNLIGDSPVREARDSPLSSSIYALTTKPWQEVRTNSDVGYKISSNTVFNPSPRKVSSSVSSTIHPNFTPTSVPLNGPLGGGQMVRHSQPQHHHNTVSSSSSGIRPPLGSVIYSSMTVSSSLPCSFSQQSFLGQSQQSLAATAATHGTPASKLQNSLPATSVSSSNSLTPQLGSASFSSSQPSQVQATNRMKIADTSHFPPNQNSQAASSEMVTGCVTPLTNQILLNSLPDKHADSQNGTSSPADNKTSSEGDENSNHSGLITDTLPEHAATAALLEHSGVKAENHDSGIGSSSERSDDTPSEPGDGEFRSGQSGVEVEDGSKASVQKPVNCKLESKVNSSSNTITVGYMVNPRDSAAQPKLTQITDVGHTSKNNVVVSTSSSAVKDISHFFHTHVMSMGKQAGILTGSLQSSMEVGTDDSKGQPNPNLPGRLRENGQSAEDLGNTSSGKVNGPSSQSSIEKMIKAAGDKQHKKIRASPKQNSKKGLVDVSAEHQKLQAEVLERMGKLHQSADSAKETSHVMSVKPTSSDKADSPDALSQRLNSSEDRPDQIIFDMEELVNGRITGSGTSGVESRGGSNITSIYSKRSSPVNVNMLNHMYAPGLPLPRRLTESVQRLVKPLPAAETSVSYSQMRPCKSPGSGGSPRAGSGVGIQSSLRMSGVRSPGASMPKLVASDKHSLLSGGLDLAGLSNLQFASATSEHSDLVTCKMGSQALASDVLFQDTHCFSSSQKSPDLLDSKSYSSKLLSLSFPPHKSKDVKPNSSHTNHGLFLSLQSNSSFSEKNISSSVNTTRHTQLPKARTESSLSSSSQDSRIHLSNRSHQDVLQSGHLSSVSDTSQARLGSQQSSAAEPTHSAVNSHVADNSSAYTSHSNAASPVMPVLQLGQDSPVTPTTASNMPSLSSQSPSSVSTAREISTANTGSSVSFTGTTLSTQNKHVPYTVSVASSGTTSNAIAKSTTVSTFLPTLSPASTAPLALGKTEDSPSYTVARPRLSLPSLELSNSKPKKFHISNNQSPSSSRSGCSTPQFSRNLFESVSGTLTQDSLSSSKLEPASENNSLDSAGHGSVHLPVCAAEGPSDSFASVSVSQESKGDQLVKSLRHKSIDSGDRRTAAGLSQSSKADLLKGCATSKSIVTSQETSLSTFLSTEVVNLDFPLPAQACDVLSLNMGSGKSNSCSGSVLKTSLSAAQSLQESAPVHTSQPSTSALSSVAAAHVSSSISRTSDSLRDTQTSAAMGKEETILKMNPGLSNSSMPLVKEPILEILASALGSSLTKTSRLSPGKLFVEKQISSSEMSMEFHRAEEEVVTESKTVTIQSGPRRAQDYSHRQSSLDLSSSDSAAMLSSDPFTRRPARKRKLTHGDDVTDEASSADPTPAKQPHMMHSLGSGVRSSAKYASAEGDLTVIHSNMRTDSTEGKDVHTGKCLSQSKSQSLIKESQEWETDKISRVSLEAPQEEADSQNNIGRTQRMSASENRDHNGPKETRPHGSVISNISSSDENLLNNTCSEVKDSAFKETRLHHSAADTGSEGKERRLHRTGAASSAAEDQHVTTHGHSSPSSLVDHKVNSQSDTVFKDSKSHRGTAEVQDEKDDQQDSSSQLNFSVEDLADSGRELSSEKPGSSDGGLSDSKLDDGQKKSHRIRRQFYAYVPEKSIDQTYFDTPILSGRTRSKNKPSDLGDAAQDEAASAASVAESHPHHPAGGQQTAAVGKAEGSAEKAGGKRPTRSVRTKDNSQEQNASKRRRVQQHR